MYAPATKIVLMRESGLKPLTKFDFAVRARNADHGGEWSVVSEYIGMCVQGGAWYYLLITIQLLHDMLRAKLHMARILI